MTIMGLCRVEGHADRQIEERGRERGRGERRRGGEEGEKERRGERWKRMKGEKRKKEELGRRRRRKGRVIVLAPLGTSYLVRETSGSMAILANL